MLSSLNDETLGEVGGKARGLGKLVRLDAVKDYVPEGFALSTEFFQGWVDLALGSSAWKELERVRAASCDAEAQREACLRVKQVCKKLPISKEQATALETVRSRMKYWAGGLAAVRSSAPEEDGADASFAGIFDSKLGVSETQLEDALRDCFSSSFDERVLSYYQRERHGFAAVVMQMVDSYKSGVAFSANPLNSDLDEMMVDSTWGLGGSVVEGLVVADRYLWDKVGNSVLEITLGSKVTEQRLADGGGVETATVSEEQRAQATLSDQDLAELAQVVSRVEASFGEPVDVEWAYTRQGQLWLLQVRPITTIFPLDPGMLTQPGEPRALYFDFHIASDATTTQPFTHMDLDAYWDVWTKASGFQNLGKPYDDNGNHLLFNGQTRQYFNVSATSKLGYGTAAMAKEYAAIDAYAASILKGKEAQDPKYKAKKLPAEVTCGNAFRFMQRIRAPAWNLYKLKQKFQKDPVKCGNELRERLKVARAEVKEIVQQGPFQLGGLVPYVDKICQAGIPVFDLQCAGAFVTLAVFKELGQMLKERDSDAGLMMLGFVNDPLMEMNIAMYRLARELPENIWRNYDDNLSALAERIQRNVDKTSAAEENLPSTFVENWQAFIEEYGFDGTDQVFVSSPRYRENPVLLLEKLRHSVGPDVPDPQVAMAKARAARQAAQERQLVAAKAAPSPWLWWKKTNAVRKIEKRNLALDEIMWVRNSPKLFQSEITGAIRVGVLACEAKLLESGRLDQPGDIFHLKIAQVDDALKDPTIDLRASLAPRKAQYLRAKKATVCPFLVDSRCRILKPDTPDKQENPNCLVGAPISPGVVTGNVRVLSNPREKVERGDIIAAIVTDPAWTPLFVGCAGIILQVGGPLQHGALCAREYGKPGVSCIDIARLKTGMRVTVDGNTGTVTVLNSDKK